MSSPKDFSEVAARLKSDCQGAITDSLERIASNAVLVPKELALDVVPVSSIKPRPVTWLWNRRIARGTVSVLFGDPGLGKSTMTVSVASRLSRGIALPDDPEKREPISVLFLPAEDSCEILQARIAAADGDQDRIFIIKGRKAAHGALTPVDLSVHFEDLAEAIDATGAELLFIDPIGAFAGATDTHVDADVRRLLYPISLLAERKDVAIVCVMHPNKGASSNPLHRLTGSVAFGATARTVLAVGRISGDRDRIEVTVAKSNVGAMPPSLSFRVRTAPGTEIGVVEWIDGTGYVKAEDLFRQPERRGKLEEAEEFLDEALSTGPVAEEEMQTGAKAAGVSVATLRRAKQSLGVKSEKIGDCWFWRHAGQDAHAQTPKGDDQLGALRPKALKQGAQEGKHGRLDEQLPGGDATGQDAHPQSLGDERLPSLPGDSSEPVGSLKEIEP